MSLSRPVFSNRRRKPLKFERDNKFHSRAQTMKKATLHSTKDEDLNIKPEEILEWGDDNSLLLKIHINR